MKIINSMRHYTKLEVADLVGRSPQTIHLWHKWSDELEEQGKARLIPAPIRWKSNYRLWSEDDVTKIKIFIENYKKGDLKEFTNLLNKRDKACVGNVHIGTNHMIIEETGIGSSANVSGEKRKRSITYHITELNQPSEHAINDLHELIVRMLMEPDR